MSLTPSGAKSKSVSRTRPLLSRRATSQHSMPYLPNGPAEFVVPSATVGEETADLLHDFVHPSHHQSEHTLVDDDTPADEQEDDVDMRERARMSAKPWWRRPTPWWFLAMAPLSMVAGGATMGPRVEILTMLACDQLRPEYTAGRGMEGLGIHPWGAPAPVVSPTLVARDQFNLAQHSSDVEFDSWQADGNGTVVPNPKLCKTDPVVQAGVAKLQAAMTTVMGILGVMTVGWWASLSDRYGRTLIVGVTICGRVFEDFNFIFVSMYAKRLPGGYWFLLIGPVLEGLLGGIAAASAAIHAYVSDCTPPDKRSRTFSLFMGAFFIGMAIGPTVGGQLVKHTANILSVYYFAFTVHTLYGLVLWLVIPESRSRVQMAAARRKHAAERAAAQAKHTGTGSRVVAAVAAPIRPLQIFVPRRIVHAGSSPGKAGKRDWSLTLVAIAHASMAAIFGGYQYKLQYALARYGWSSVEIGYWLTSVGFSRALHLAIILPIIIKLLKPKAPAIQLPVEEDEPLASATTPAPASSSASVSPSRHPRRSAHTPHHNTTLRFDLGLARGSLLVDILAYTLIPFAPSGSTFIGASVLGSFGGGFGPAVQAIALELFARQPGRSAAQAGTLFGALSVLTASVSQVLGPALFGGVYLATVAVFPAAIFVLSACLMVFSLVLLLCVRLPPANDVGDAEVAASALEREATAVADEEDEEGRGRKVTATD